MRLLEPYLRSCRELVRTVDAEPEENRLALRGQAIRQQLDRPACARLRSASSRSEASRFFAAISSALAAMMFCLAVSSAPWRFCSPTV